MSNSLQSLLATQSGFSDLFFDAKSLSEEELIERHKIFALALHSEVTSLADAVHYKDHRPFKKETQRQKILYESVDLFRYCLAILNLWDFTAEEFEDAFDSRDAFLWDRETRGLQMWDGAPIIIFDVDDVVAQFRKGFFDWVEDRFGVKLDLEAPNYYVMESVGDMSNEEAYRLFIREGGIRNLSVNQRVVDAMERLRKSGFWIHLLTARPNDNLKCLYDTHFWLSKFEIPYDSITLISEKYRWLMNKDFFKQGKVVCAVDDSPKHALEFAQHGIKVCVPRRGYNSDVWDVDNVTPFDWWEDDLDETIQELLSQTAK